MSEHKMEVLIHLILDQKRLFLVEHPRRGYDILYVLDEKLQHYARPRKTVSGPILVSHVNEPLMTTIHSNLSQKHNNTAVILESNI